MDSCVSLMMREDRPARLEKIGHRAAARMSEPVKTARAESWTIGA
jgi:hypothetical protein